MIKYGRFRRESPVLLFLTLFPAGGVAYWTHPCVILTGFHRQHQSCVQSYATIWLDTPRTRCHAALDDNLASSDVTNLKKQPKKSATRRKSNRVILDTQEELLPTKTAKTKAESSYWLVDDDKIEVEYTKEQLRLFHFKIRGNPRPLVRHRSGNGHMYSPSAVYRDAFRKELIQIITSKKMVNNPLFREEDYLAVSIVLRMKRPSSHFVSGKRGPERLKATAPRGIGQFRTDVDNMVKFLLDAMNTIVYPDDRQIFCLRVTRVLDNEGLCEGSTEIRLRTIQEDDCDTLIENTFQNVES